MVHIPAEALRDLVENYPHLVTMKQSKRYPDLFVLKYRKRVFYDNLWSQHPMLIYCRGLIVDKDFNVVIKPLTKVFNYQENGVTIEQDALVHAIEKVNGFMACVSMTEYSDNLIISTTGSLDSDFVALAEEFVLPFEEDFKNAMMLNNVKTLVFEVCHPSDPHIIKEKEGLHLLAANRNLIGGMFEEMDYGILKRIYNDLRYSHSVDDSSSIFTNVRIGQIYLPQGIAWQFSEILEEVRENKTEGWMVNCLSTGTVLKLKSPYYLVTKFLARAREDKLLDQILIDNSQVVKQRVDEEFYPLIDFIQGNKEEFVSLREQDRIEFIEHYFGAA